MLPLASVITPTYGRPRFLRRAVERFLAYSYPSKEMLILDDSPRPQTDLPPSPLVKYFHMKERLILGEKHNYLAAQAQGEVIVHQDDDDWYSGRRLQLQLEPIALGRTDMTGFPVNLVLHGPTGQFYRFRPGVRFNIQNEPDAMIWVKFHDSASCYHRRVWDSGLRYPAWAGGEKLSFINKAVERGFRHEPIANQDRFVYVRHAVNTWQYRDWLVHQPADRPWWFPKEDLAFYRGTAA